jgi:hypothetical protein
VKFAKVQVTVAIVLQAYSPRVDPPVAIRTPVEADQVPALPAVSLNATTVETGVVSVATESVIAPLAV